MCTNTEGRRRWRGGGGGSFGVALERLTCAQTYYRKLYTIVARLPNNTHIIQALRVRAPETTTFGERAGVVSGRREEGEHSMAYRYLDNNRS